MPRSIPVLRALCAALAGACTIAHAAPTTLPVAPAKAASDTYFGTTVTDGYRSMEDLAAPEVQQWARAQSEHARSVLDALPGRAALLARIDALDASDKGSMSNLSLAAGGLVFYEKRGAGEERGRLYVRKGFQGAERLLVDAGAPAAGGGVPHAIEFYQPSHDGKYVAYAVSTGGSQDAVIHVVDVATGKEQAGSMDRAERSYVNWLPDDSGFVYLRLQALPPGAPQTEKFRNAAAFLHRLAGKGADTLVLAAGTNARLHVTLEELPVVKPLAGTPWVVATPNNGSEREMDLYAAPVAKTPDAKTAWRKLFGREAEITGFAVHGDDLYLLSHLNASRYKVLQTSMAHPDVVLAHVVVAPGRDVIDRIAAAKDALYVQAHDGTTGKLYRVAYARDAQPVPVLLPAAGAVRIVDSDLSRPGVIVSIASWTHDTAFYSVGAQGGQVVDTGLQARGPFGAPADLVAEEVLVKSHDGLKVPLSIVHRKDMKLDGSNPTALAAYGAYGVTDDPVYLPRMLAWYELGGVMATCHVRGGGIQGEQWHVAAKQLTKPDTWRDLIACGEYLVKQGYTGSAKLALAGSGAGGIAVGRAMTARPELWAAVVTEAGDFNTVRAETSAMGLSDIPEFGTVKDKQQFNGLLEMDAFHHVEDGVKYPAALLMHGIDDPRVPAWASMKMAARLQEATASGKPVLLRIGDDDGQGGGGSGTRRAEQDADRWTFMLWQFDDPRFQPAVK